MQLDDENDIYAAQTKAYKRTSTRLSRSLKPATENGDEEGENAENGKRVETFVNERQEYLRKIEKVCYLAISIRLRGCIHGVMLGQDGKALDAVANRISKEITEEEDRIRRVAKELASDDAAFHILQERCA